MQNEQLMNNSAFDKTLKNINKHGNIKLVTKDERRNYFASETNYHTTKWFLKNVLAIEIKKNKL